MRKALTMTVAGLVLAGCGGSSLPEQDKSLADSFWDNLSTLEQQVLCQKVSSPASRLQSARELSMKLTNDEVTSEADGSDIVTKAKRLEVNDPRAEAIVLYLHDEKC